MSIVTIQVNNTKSITLNNKLWNYSKFQLKFMNDLLQTPGFQHLVLPNFKEYKGQTVRKPHWLVVLWYANDVLHSQRVGVNRILSELIIAE